MKKIGIVLLILISLIGTLLGCGKQDVNKDLESIEASEIKQIEHTGTTGGKDGNYSYSFSDDEVIEFINLLNYLPNFMNCHIAYSFKINLFQPFPK